MTVKKIGLPLLILAAAWSCVELVEPQMFRWRVSFDFPITSKTITLGEYLDDPKIQEQAITIDGISYEGGYMFKDSVDIPEQSVGDQFTVDDMAPQYFTQNVEDVKVDGTNKTYSSGFDTVGVAPVLEDISSELGPIELENTDPITPSPVTFMDLFPGVGNDVSFNIPAGTDMPSIYRDVEFSEIDNATFLAGEMSMIITNDLVIELGSPIEVSILDADSNLIVGSDMDPATAEWTAPILPGNFQEQRINLGNKTLPANIIVKVTGKVCSSAAADVTTNQPTRDSNFTIRVQAVDLVVSSATAQIPEQVIDTTGVIELEASDTKVVRSRIMEGNLAININNKLAVPAYLDLFIPSIDTLLSDEVDTFRTSIYLPPSTYTPTLKDLNDFYLVMDENDQKVSYGYLIRTVDTGGDKVAVTENDGVDVEIKLYGIDESSDLTFKTFRGFVTQDPIHEEGEIDISSDSRISNAVLSQGSITISIENGVNLTSEGVPNLTLEIPQLQDPNGNHIYENLDLLPGTNLIDIDLRNYTLVPTTDLSDPENVKQYMTYATDIVIPSDVLGAYNLLDSINVDINVSELIFNTVTGYFNQDAMTDRNTIELETDVTIADADIADGALYVTVENHIGVIADVKFTVNELIDQNGLPLKKTISLSESSEPVETVIPLTNYTVTMDTSGVAGPQSLNYSSVIALPSDEEMTLNFGQEIQVTVEIKDLSFESVSGKVDSIVIDIDPIAQSLDAIPSEMEGLEFWSVDMGLVLDTDISIPLYLELNLAAKKDGQIIDQFTVNDRLIPGLEFMIPNAQRLINLFPDSILATGRAIADGAGSIKSSDKVKGHLNIGIPLVFNIDEPVELSLDPELNEGQDIPQELESATMYAEIFSAFDFGVIVDVLAAADTNYFTDGSGLVDTIASLEIPARANTTQTLSMDQHILDILSDSTYIKNKVVLSGNGDKSKVLSTDSLSIKLYGTIEALVDTEPDSDGQGE